MLSQALKHIPQVPDASSMSFSRPPRVPSQVLYASSDHPMGTWPVQQIWHMQYSQPLEVGRGMALEFVLQNRSGEYFAGLKVRSGSSLWTSEARLQTRMLHCMLSQERQTAYRLKPPWLCWLVVAIVEPYIPECASLSSAVSRTLLPGKKHIAGCILSILQFPHVLEHRSVLLEEHDQERRLTGLQLQQGSLEHGKPTL